MANNTPNANASECSYIFSQRPPARTGQGVVPGAMVSSSVSGGNGRDSADPHWRSFTVSSTYMPICRNSLSQFSNNAPMKWPLCR